MTNAPLVSVRLPRLAAPMPASGKAPTPAEIGLGALDQELLSWELLCEGGWFWELAAAVGPATQRDRWLEIAGLFGGTAEALRMAATATVEMALLRDAIAAGTLKPFSWLGVRFFAESQGQMTLGAGHRMANLLARALMLDPDYPWSASVPCELKTPFPVYSDHKDHWVQIGMSRTLKKIARASRRAALVQMATVLRELEVTGRWKRLNDQRGSDFHRAREETPVVARARRAPVWQHQTLLVGPPQMPDPTQAARAVEAISTVSREGLEALGDRLSVFREAWVEAMSELSDGRLTATSGRLHFEG